MEGHILVAIRHSLYRAIKRSSISQISQLVPQSIRQYHATPSPQLRSHDRANSDSDRADVSQAYPLSGYYSDILSARFSHRGQATTSPSAPEHKSNAPPDETPEMPQSPEDKMAIVFGTRLAGPGRSSRYDPKTNSTWKTVNGVPIPPRPAEPDNCCMSGCVHCVWDDYRDEIEEWAEMLAQAKAKKLPKSPNVIPGAIPKSPKDTAGTSTSMDDDGGGSETNWSAPTSSDDLFADIPVGIREFMRTEKRLKQVHRQERDSP
ncbi:oxidoreductase-like protein [Aspergillus californicus]